MLNFARTSLDIVAPAGDLLQRNAYDILMTDVSSGFVVGKGIIEGVRCDHLAFRAPHVDWQIWIEDGARPLPRKLVITTRDVVNAPQFAVVVTRWDLQPKQTDGMFTFTPPRARRRSSSCRRVAARPDARSAGMNIRTSRNSLSLAVAALALPGLLVIEFEWTDGPAIRVLRSAHAIVGAPMTPVSVAGVARRTTYRVVAAETATVAAAGASQQQAVAQQQAATAKQQQATAQQQAATAQQQQAVGQQQAAAQQAAAGAPAIGTVVPALPSGCTTEPRGEVQYYRCGNVYYRAAFQSNNLVYVVQPAP